MKTMKKVLSVLLTVSMLFALVTVAFAENGPYNDPESVAYIALADVITATEEPDMKYIWAKNATELVEAVPGVSYDEATNTVTIENVNMPKYAIICTDMGNDFKVNVVGENNLAAVCAMAWDWTAGLEITGNGKLTLNAERTLDDAPVSVYAGLSDGGIVIGNQVTLNIGITDPVELPAFAVLDTTKKTDSIVINGSADKKLLYTSEMIDEETNTYVALAGPEENTLVIAPQTTAPTVGDVNGDGDISIVDAKLVLQSIAGTTLFTAPQKQAADVKADGKISIADAKAILKIIANAK